MFSSLIFLEKGAVTILRRLMDMHSLKHQWHPVAILEPYSKVFHNVYYFMLLRFNS